MNIGQFLLGAVGAVLAWMVTEFLGRPFRQFFDLRRETTRKMVEYANVTARAKMDETGSSISIPITSTEEERLLEAEKTFRDLAAQIRGFAIGELVASKTVKLLKYDAMEISRALIGYESNIGTHGKLRADSANRIRKLLRLREEP
jgi:hypothetical protein